jgi:hypothetical protein
MTLNIKTLHMTFGITALSFKILGILTSNVKNLIITTLSIILFITTTHGAMTLSITTLRITTLGGYTGH